MSAARFFRTDSVQTHYAVVIVRTGVPIVTTNNLELAKDHLRQAADKHGDLEVREVVVRTESRRAFSNRLRVVA